MALALIAAATLLACVDIPTGSDDLLSFQLNALPSPSVIVGDTLRDSSGVVAPLSITAFNFSGDTVPNVPVRFRALDARVRVDSVTGLVRGDSINATASRLLASIDGFDGIFSIPVVPRPDTVVGANARDTLAYSLTDTTLNLSNAIGVRVLHGPAAVDSAVRAFVVKFEILSHSDTVLVRLVDDARRRSAADTTDATGTAARRIRLDVTRLVTAVDSVIVQANVRYRGQHVRGSPMRLVLKLKPR